MSRIFHPLLALIASATDRELARYVQYLKEENKILRKRIKGEIHTKPSERERLIKFGKSLGRAIEELITIVSPGTFYRWLHDGDEPTSKRPKGGQRKAKEIRELVIQIAKVTGFGYTRIVGEMRKMGIKKISRQTVRNILKEEGIEPGPDRASDTWDEFLKRHGATLWGCDFFSVKTVTARGIREMHLDVSTGIPLSQDSGSHRLHGHRAPRFGLGRSTNRGVPRSNGPAGRETLHRHA